MNVWDSFHPWAPKSCCELSKGQTSSQAAQNQNSLCSFCITCQPISSSLTLQCYCFACFSLTSLMYRAIFIKIPLTVHFQVWIPFSLSWFSNLLNPVTLCLSPHWCFVTSFNLELSLHLISTLWTLSFRLLMKMLNACKTSSNNGPCCTWLNNLLQLHKLL